MAQEMSGGKAVVEALKAEGVTHVFGLIGSAGMEIFDALYDARGIRFIGVRDERTGVHMADGYARASRRAGVFVAGQNGPGATNIVTGLAQANAAYSPVVAIAGLLSSAHVYRGAFQEVDQQALFTPVTKRTWTVSQTARIPEMVREAFSTALAPRQGPVVLNIPRDTLSETAAFETPPAPSSYRAASIVAGDANAVRAAAEVLAVAQRPLIIAGGGIKNARTFEAAIALAERLNAPIAMSPGHGDAIPCTNRLYAGQVGPRGNSVASDLAKRADVIVALGTRLGFNTTFYSYDNLNRGAKIIHIDLEHTAVGRFFPIEVGIVGDAATVASQLVVALGEGKPSAETNTWCREFQENRRRLIDERDAQGRLGGDPIQPASIYHAIRETAPEDSIFTLDAGTLCLQATDQLPFRHPPALFTPLDFGLVGFSYAAGLGVKLALPNRTVISLMGDGGFGMTTSELGTAVANGISTVCIVMNNGCWGAEKAYQRDFFGERYLGADVPNPPYDKLAQLWGAAGFRVDKAAHLAAALREAFNCGRPAIVDVHVDPKALYSFRRDSFKHREKPSKTV